MVITTIEKWEYILKDPIKIYSQMVLKLIINEINFDLLINC